MVSTKIEVGEEKLDLCFISIEHIKDISRYNKNYYKIEYAEETLKRYNFLIENNIIYEYSIDDYLECEFTIGRLEEGEFVYEMEFIEDWDFIDNIQEELKSND